MNGSKLLNFLRRRSLTQWLLAITVIYLFWQISLSGAILTASSMESSDRLSELARKTVGFGMALFVFRVTCGRLALIISLALALVLGWCAMWAENALVEYFAEQTSAQERLEAKTIQLFNNALARDRATLPALAREIAADRVKSRTFAKVLGFAIWNNPPLLRQLDERMESVLKALYTEELYKKVDDGYDQYASAFKTAKGKVDEARAAIAHINFALYADELNGQLGKYAACVDAGCRKAINDRVARYMRQRLPELNLEINLEDFCKNVQQPARYVLGRSVPGKVDKVCSVNEKELYAWAMAQVDKKIGASWPDLKDYPEKISTAIRMGDFVSLAQWRDLWEKEIDSEVAKRKLAEFSNPGRYGKGGVEEAQGKAYAISIFLPPIALGFSITVCFLHLASLFAAFTHKPALCGLVAFGIWAAPFILAASVPLGGLAGLYARWLVFWEGCLYPFGLLRWLMP